MAKEGLEHSAEGEQPKAEMAKRAVSVIMHIAQTCLCPSRWRHQQIALRSVSRGPSDIFSPSLGLEVTCTLRVVQESLCTWTDRIGPRV